jgi:hypothetical protein
LKLPYNLGPFSRTPSKAPSTVPSKNLPSDILLCWFLHKNRKEPTPKTSKAGSLQKRILGLSHYSLFRENRRSCVSNKMILQSLLKIRSYFSR